MSHGDSDMICIERDLLTSCFAIKVVNCSYILKNNKKNSNKKEKLNVGAPQHMHKIINL